MTIANTTGLIEYVGDGTTTDFAIPFEYDADSIKAYINGVNTTSFTVVGTDVVFTVAPAIDDAVLIVDDPAIAQPYSYANVERFPSTAHEAALDRIVRLIRRLDVGLNTIVIDGGLPTVFIEKVSAMAALDVDATLANVFTKTLAAPSTLTFSNEIAGASFTLEITNSGGAQAITWPASVRWPGDLVPTPTAGIDVYVFFYNGVVWRGALSASYAS